MFSSLSSNAPPSSAVCLYSLSDINKVFDESLFKSYDKQDNQWSTVENKHEEYFKDVSSFLFAPYTVFYCRELKQGVGGGGGVGAPKWCKQKFQ